MIELDVDGRRLHLDIPEEELRVRLDAWSPPPVEFTRGWAQLYVDHVTQADTGCDLDFLIGGSGAPVPRESH